MSSLEEEQLQLRQSKSYPHVLPLSPTHCEFPSSHAVMDRSAMAYGFLLTPFISRKDAVVKSCRLVESASQVARCTSCQGYLNPFCDTSSSQWVCCLCGTRNIIPRSSSRYRGADYRNLEETQCSLVDYPVPFRSSSDGCPHVLDGKMSANCSAERPLVHIFLIQDSAPVEVLQAVSASLISAIDCMHPDVQIVIATFSNHLNVYQLSACRGRQNSNSPGGRGDAGKSPLAEHERDECVASIPFVNSTYNSLSENKLVDLVPQVPISSAIDFFSAAAPVGACREAASSILRGLLGASVRQSQRQAEVAESNSSDRVGVEVDDFDEVEDSLSANDGKHYLHGQPQVFIGPVLDAIYDWVTEAGYVGDVGDKAQNDFEGREPEHEEESGGGGGGFVSTVFGVLRNIARGFIDDLSGSDSSVERRPALSGRNSGGGGEGETQLPATSRCSGLILHLFVASPQDLPEESHESVPSQESSLHHSSSNSAFADHRPGLSRDWIVAKGKKFLGKSIQTNVWGICAQESDRIGLSSLYPLAEYTGGAVTKIALHSTTTAIGESVSRGRLTEQLRRVLSASILATKCVFRLRASPIIEFESATGHFKEDEELPGVYRIAGCSDATTFGWRICYKNSADGSTLNPGERENKIALQLAFSYETLVETEKDRESQDVNEKARREEKKPSETGVPGASYFSLIGAIFGMKREVETLLDFESREGGGSAASKAIPAKFENGGRRHLTKSRNRHGATRNKSSCCAYDRSSALVAVKRLRVFTITFQCTHRIPRLLQCRRVVTSAVLIARLACIEVMSQSHRTPPGNMREKQPAAALELVEAWAVAFVASQASSLKAINADASAATNEALADSSLKRLLAMLFGAIQALRLHNLLSQSSSIDIPEKTHTRAKNQASRVYTDDIPRLSMAETDTVVARYSLFQTTEAYSSHKIIYPICVAIRDDRVICEPIPLTREAMVMSSSSTFLFDSGEELVLFREYGGRKSGFFPREGMLDFPSREEEETASLALCAEQELSVVRCGDFKTLDIRVVDRDMSGGGIDETTPGGVGVDGGDGGDNVEGTDKPCAVFPGISDPDWLPNYIKRQLDVCSVVPLVIASHAGTSSAAHMTSMLVEDSTEADFLKFVHITSNKSIGIIMKK